MRILQLRLKNLNSLRGEWHIDFEAGEYTGDGIFAITGPTGAGKSTILDAICLALYGSTPRLGRISQSGNEIMSRGTGTCFAELLFSAGSGSYRCQWSQHRARQRPEGRLAEPKHEISREPDGQLIEYLRSKVPAKITDITGLSLPRFTRSVLLAQGSFDLFLRSDTEQKSEILEQITGTKIYSEISRRVFERSKAEKIGLEETKALLDGHDIPPPEEAEKLREELAEATRHAEQLGAEYSLLNHAISQYRLVENLEVELAHLEKEAKDAERKYEAFSAEQRRLEAALSAAEAGPEWSRLQDLRSQKSQEQASLHQALDELAELKKIAEGLEQAFCNARSKTDEARGQMEHDLVILGRISACYKALGQQKAEREENEQEQYGLSRELDLLISLADTTKEEKQQAETQAAQFADFLTKIPGEETLAALTEAALSLEKELRQQQTKQQKAKRKEKQCLKALNEMAQQVLRCHKSADVAEKSLLEASKELDREQKKLKEILCGRLLREYRAEKEALQKEELYLAKIASLESLRAGLKDNEPCPLCGSREHPFFRNSADCSDNIQRRSHQLDQIIRRAEQSEDRTAALDKRISDLTALKAEAAQALASSRLEADQARKALREATDIASELNSELADQQRALEEILSKASMDPPKDIKKSKLVELLRQQRSMRRQYSEGFNTVQQKGLTLGKKEDKYRLKIALKHSRLKASENHLSTLTDRICQLESDIRTLWDSIRGPTGEKNPQAAEKELQDALAECQEDEKKISDKLEKARQRLAASQGSVKSLKDRLLKLTDEERQSEQDFTKTLSELGLYSEKAFLSARLPREKLTALETESSRRLQQKTEATARLLDRAEQLKKTRQSLAGNLGFEGQKAMLREKETGLERARELQFQLNFKYKRQKELREERQCLTDKYQQQKSEFHRWERLNQLIGSADGRKFRNYAQGLGFDMLIGAANLHLQKMNGRYLLLRDQNGLLDLSVADLYQAGEVRSTRNLSGGECFLVSLSLALALSEMNSQKAPVDSLFLDEGFGTLDEEALDTALQTLSELRHEGKLIGIISHVPAIKERIPTRITLTPQSGGLSTLSGPGVTNITQPR